MAGLLRPIVSGQTVKYNTKKRAGRGFTLEELKVRRGEEGGLCVRVAWGRGGLQQRRRSGGGDGGGALTGGLAQHSTAHAGEASSRADAGNEWQRQQEQELEKWLSRAAIKGWTQPGGVCSCCFWHWLGAAMTCGGWRQQPSWRELLYGAAQHAARASWSGRLSRLRSPESSPASVIHRIAATAATACLAPIHLLPTANCLCPCPPLPIHHPHPPQEAGIPAKLAPTIGIAVDHRRRNRSLEGLQVGGCGWVCGSAAAATACQL